VAQTKKRPEQKARKSCYSRTARSQILHQSCDVCVDEREGAAATNQCDALPKKPRCCCMQTARASHTLITGG